jgi:hypothetical protein
MAAIVGSRRSGPLRKHITTRGPAPSSDAPGAQRDDRVSSSAELRVLISPSMAASFNKRDGT